MKRKYFLALVVVMLLCVCLAACEFGSSDDTPPDGKATLTAEMIKLNVAPTYTGEPIVFDASFFEIRLNGRKADASQFSYTYADNVNVGTATVTVTAKPECPVLQGSADITFAILPATATVNNYTSLKQKLADPNYSDIYFDGEAVVPSGDTLTVPSGRTLQFNSGCVLTVEGTLAVDGTLVLYNSTTSYGYGSLVNNGRVEIRRNAKMYAVGGLTGNGGIVNDGTVYFNGSAPDDIGGRVVVRRDLADAQIQLGSPEIKYEKGKTDYRQSKLTVSHPQSGDVDGNRFSPVYSDNDAVGTATVTLTAPVDDELFYGSAVAHFEIVPGDVTVTSIEDMQAAFDDPDYGTVTLLGINRPSGDIAVPSGYTLIVPSSLYIGGSLSNLGIVKVGGTLAFGGYSDNGKGKIINTGTIYSNCDHTFDADLFDNASGTLYSYTAQPDIPDAIEKHDIADPATGFAFEQTRLAYNGTSQTPAVTLNYSYWLSDQRRVTFYRDGQSTDDLTSVGTIEARYSVLDNVPNAYRGTATISYEIVRGAANVVRSEQFAAAIGDTGYETVTLHVNINKSTSSFALSEGIELDLNGFSVECGNFDNHGTLINPYDGDLPSSPTGSDVGLLVGDFHNYGTVVNDGIIATKTSGAWIQHDGATLINNGEMYVNEYDGVIGGSVHERVFAAQLDLSLEYTQTYYDGNAKTPVLTATKDGRPFAAPEMAVTYSSNTDAGTASVTLSGGSGIFATFLGTRSLQFTIMRGSTTVSDKTALLAALDNANWQLITLADDIAVGASAIEVLDDTVLDLGEHILMPDEGNVPVVPASSSITATATTVSDLQTLLHSATDITLGSDIGNGDVITVKGVDAPLDVSLDMNGHILAASIVFDLGDNYTNVTITDSSSAKTGAISGSPSSDAAISISETNYDGRISLSIDNVAIAGLSVQLLGTATLEFDGCEISEGTNGYGVYFFSTRLPSITALFEGCTVTATNAVRIASHADAIEFSQCEITGTGNYSAPSDYNCGNGYAVAVNFDTTVAPVFEGCTLTSVNGYALVQTYDNSFDSYPSTSYSVTLRSCTLTGAAGQISASLPDNVFVS